jgi:superfamily I DNA/RNA helicase/RecB family exonuclease
LAVGGPGTGKTRLVQDAALAALESGECLVLARTRKEASRMRNRIVRALPSSVWTPRVTTANAFAWSIFSRFNPGIRLLDAPEQEYQLRELLSGSKELWPQFLAPALGTRTFASRVRGALQRVRQLGLDPVDVRRFGAEAGKPEWEALGAFFEVYLDVLEGEQAVDYAECTHRARLALAEPEKAAQLLGKYQAIVVDDFTDLDPSQIGLLSDALPASRRLLATGDPNTNVYGFRGAHPRAAERFAEFFGGTVIELKSGYRQGPVLAKALAGVRSRLPLPLIDGQARVLDPVPACGGLADAAQVRLTATPAEEARFVAQQVAAQHAKGRAYKDMAVLLRSPGRQLGEYERALAAEGIEVSKFSADIALAQAPAVQPLLLALRAVLSPAGKAKALLVSPIGGLDPLDLRVLQREARSLGMALGPQLFDQLLAEPGVLRGVDRPQAKAAVELSEHLQAARGKLESGATPAEIAWEFWNGTAWSKRLIEAAKGNDENARLADRDLDALVEFFAFAAEVNTVGEAGVKQLLGEVQAQQLPADTAREDRVVNPGVTLCSVFQAKGSQWDFVAIPGVQEGSWPRLRGGAGMLDPEWLTLDGVVQPDMRRQILATDRKLFYLACGTAKEELLVTAAKEAEGQPSRFLTELGVPVLDAQDLDVPRSLAQLTSSLRKKSALGNTWAEREGAAANLRWLSKQQIDGEPAAPKADPYQWWLYRTNTDQLEDSQRTVFRISPSQVSTLLSCPRRYFLAIEARAEQPSASAQVGTAVHKVVEELQRGSLDVESARVRLEEIFAGLVFGSELEAVSELERAVRMVQAADRWLRQRRDELVGAEVDFDLDVEVEGVKLLLHGRIDRLERVGDQLLAVDFKTGQEITKDQAAALDQVGIYQLAIERGLEGVAKARSAGGLLVYLKKETAAGLPTEREQQSLDISPHLIPPEPGEDQYENWITHHLALAARELIAGDFPAKRNPGCGHCQFSDSCPIQGRQVLA